MATFPVGYADGYRRSVSNKFYVLIKGKKAPMIVTPREIDMLIDRAAVFLSNAVNCFLQPDTDRNILLSIV